jgi:hypothetical protein
MLLNEFRRFIAWLTRPSIVNGSAGGAGTASPAVEFDPMWHGDHWQNLLSSPMDARRYVMEDWSVAPSIDWDSTEHAVPAR